MSKSTLLIRQSLFQRPRRHIAGSSSQQTSTSPQRRNVAAPAVEKSVRPFSEIPGPIALPMLRHSAHVLPRIGSYHHTVGLGLLEGLRDKYGDLVRLAKASRTRPVLYVFDPEHMREVYESHSTEPPRFDKSPLCHHRKGVGQCPAHGEESKAIWAAIRALLQDDTLLKSYEKAFEDIAADTTRRLGELRHAENALNDELETEIYRWAIETIGMMVFGIRLGCLDGAAHVPCADTRQPEKTSMDDEIEERCSLSKRSLEELTAAERLVRCSRDISSGHYLVRSEGTLRKDSPTFNSALKAFDRHFSLTEHFLTKALEQLKSGDLRPEQMLLDKLRPLGRRILPLADDILLAGVDPLAQSALHLVQQLSVQAARQQRAHDEVCWRAAARREGSREPAVYVAACAREALRLRPATGGVVRRARQPLCVGGFHVPAGVDIVLAHGVSSTCEREWRRAPAFVPERWSHAAGGAAAAHPLHAAHAHTYSSLPFGHTCPGEGVVVSMLSALTSSLLEQYRVEWHGPQPAATALNKLHPPYYFVLQPAA